MSIFGREYGAYKRGKEDAEHRARIQAFAAIRAAAQVARNADSDWEEWDEYIDPDVSIPAFRAGVRRAIRSAIAASKAPRGDYEVKP